jgi:dipeptidyl-peptidase 4
MATVETARLTVAADGGRVVFLRDHALWTYELRSGTERLVARGLSDAYATDALARTAVFSVRDRLHRADLVTGEVTAVPTAWPAGDPRPDPTGRRIGYLSGGGLRTIDEHGTDTLLAGEPDPADGGHPYVTWGRAEPAAARHFGRDRGWWWAPDGRRVLAARIDETRPRT